MSQVILLKSTKVFRGPFTHDETPDVGETPITLSDAQYATWNERTRMDNLDRPRPFLFDAAASPCFYRASLVEAAAVADTIDDMLYYHFARIQGSADLDLIRVKLMDRRAMINKFADIYGKNFGIVRSDIRKMIETALINENNTTVLAIQADALAASQWNLP